jgi:hypothetical protein
VDPPHLSGHLYAKRQAPANHSLVGNKGKLYFLLDPFMLQEVFFSIFQAFSFQGHTTTHSFSFLQHPTNFPDRQ